MKAAYEDMYADTRMIREKRKKMHAKQEGDPGLPPKPSPEEKCPVCGMFVAKYPDWTGVITFAGGERQYFDGAKDLFKYLFGLEKYNPQKTPGDIRHIHVTDYYDMKFIDANAAFFVIGSDVYGPMGRELIPLASRPDAETFMKDHNGIKILQFDEITPETISGLD
jgi:nitrous oxide reductase accessory protein NosL